MNIRTTTWASLLLSAILCFISVSKDYYFINLTLETSKGITSTIIGASGAFIGFMVIYLSISFENFKKVYGQYANDFYRKDGLTQNLLLLFILPILFGLTSYIFADSKTLFSKWLFNITCFYFFIAILFLLPYANAIIKKSSSNSLIEKLIFQLTEQDFNIAQKGILKNVSTFQIFQQSDNSKINKISHILFLNIQEKNGKNGMAILFDLFKKVQLLLNDGKIPVDLKRNVVIYYAGAIRDSFDLYHGNKDSLGIKSCLTVVNSLNEIVSKNKFDEKFIETAFDVIVYITKSLIESENESLISEALWIYYYMSDDQLTYNTANEKDIWDVQEDGLVVPKNTNFALENDAKFEKIDEFVSYRLSDVIDRVFLAKNYHIIEDCVRMLSSFTKMIIYNKNLGELQKNTIGGMLAYCNGESIKKYVISNYPRKHGYLNFYLHNVTMLHALKQGSGFSKVLFDTYIELVDFLIENDNMDIYDLKEVAGLCRLIIAHSESIRDSDDYVDKIIIAQKGFKVKCLKEIVSQSPGNLAKREKEIVSQIQNDIKSYLEIMQIKHITNDKLKEIVTK